MEEISNEEEISFNGGKIIETGLLLRLPKLNFGILFEELPIWLAALDHTFVENIIFPHIESMDSLVNLIGSKPGSFLFLNIIQSFDRNLYKFNKQELRSCQLLLISGSLSFFHDVTKNENFGSFLFITESNTRVRSLPSTNFNFQRLTHSQFGGPTKFQALFSMSGRGLVIKIPSLRRTLASFIDFGLRPTWVKPFEKILDQNSIVHPKLLQMPVRYSTTFSATGFGFRSLNHMELGRIFGLPAQHIVKLDVKDFCFTPVQILDSILRQFVQHHFGAINLQRPVVQILSTPTPVLETSPVFLPALGRVLPQDWRIVVEIEDKAAKSDDAAIPLHLWNKRITCFWPNSENALDVIRNFFLRIHFRSTFRSFVVHLKRAYPVGYAHFMKIRASCYARRFHGERLGGMGGANKITNGLHLMPLMPLLDQKPNCEDKFETSNLAFSDLLVDIALGIKALSTYFQSTFFEWKNGSSLLFWNWANELQQFAKFGFPPFIGCGPP